MTPGVFIGPASFASALRPGSPGSPGSHGSPGRKEPQ